MDMSGPRSSFSPNPRTSNHRSDLSFLSRTRAVLPRLGRKRGSRPMGCRAHQSRHEDLPSNYRGRARRSLTAIRWSPELDFYRTGR
jgi:hypothetical protein